MKTVPSNCFKCGAPIKWDKVSSFITCEYCGATNSFQTPQTKNNNFRNKVLGVISTVTTKARKISEYCLENQTLISNRQVKHISSQLNNLFNDKDFKVLLVVAPIIMIGYSIKNDPVRPYKSDIHNQCIQMSNDQSKTDFYAKDVYQKCKSNLSRELKLIAKLSQNKKSKLYTDQDTKSKYPITTKGIGVFYYEHNTGATIWFTTGLEKEMLEIKNIQKQNLEKEIKEKEKYCQKLKKESEEAYTSLRDIEDKLGSKNLFLDNEWDQQKSYSLVISNHSNNCWEEYEKLIIKRKILNSRR